MTSIGNIVEFLKSEFLSIQDITDEWMSSCVDGNYADFASISAIFIPSFYDDGNATQRLKELAINLANFGVECDDPEVWHKLTDADISGKQLSMLLWYSLEWALAKPSSFDLIERGTYAACGYLYLASIKGSKAYHIFNPYLYQKCLQIFRLLYRCLMFECCESDLKRKVIKKGNSKKKQQSSMMEIDEAGVENELNVAMSFERKEIKYLFEQASEALFTLLNKVALSSHAEIPLMTTLLVRDMARIDICQDTSVEVAQHYHDFKKLPRLSDRSFALMHRLVENRHTEGAYLVISRIIYPRLAFWTFDLDVIPSSSTIPVSFYIWKDLMVKFIRIRAEIGNKSELDNIFKMLENLCNRCTDRLEYRTRLAQSVLDVLLVMPRSYHFDFVERLHIFSRIQKVSVRNFSIEIVPLLLQNLDLPNFFLHDGKSGAKADDSVAVVSGSDTNAMEVDEDAESNVGEFGNTCVDNVVEGNLIKEETKSMDVDRLSPTPLQGSTPVEVLQILYTCVIRSCFDKASTLRLRAMFHLALLVEDEQHCLQLDHFARKMFEQSPKIFMGEYGVNEAEEIEFNCQEEVLEKMFLDDSEIVINNLILHIILSGAVDDTAGVRKNSMLALRAYFPRITDGAEAESSIDCLKNCCLDGSLMVRRQAAETLDHLLCTSHRFRESLENAWLTAVLPMVNDREGNVQHLISRLVTKTILNPLMGETDEVAWNMLHAIELENNNRRLLHRALTLEYQEGNIQSTITTMLNRKLEVCPVEVDVIWMLLADLSAIFKVKPDKATEAWFNIVDGDPKNRVRYVAKVLSQSCDDLESNIREKLSSDIESKISQFRIDAPNISSAYHCLARIVNAIGEEGTGREKLEKIGKTLLRICREHIRESLLEIKDEYDDPEKLNIRETLLIRVVLTIGEIVQFSPNLMSSAVRLFDALKTILASDVFHEEDLCVVNSAIPSIQPTPLHSREHSPSRPPTSSDQGDCAGSQPISSQNYHVIPRDIIKASKATRRALFTKRVRAHAVLTIGKFCLMDEKIAKSTIPVFVKQLRMNKDHVIRNNIALVICDLCIRYTSMVDRYSPIVAACLKDSSTLVRQQTLQSLTSLIKEQFIRWEGQIMYRFVSTILDENKVIRDYTKFCLRDVLLPQFPGLFSNHFIECLMYFNKAPGACEAKGVQQSIDPAQHVSLHSSSNFENRMTIYKFMLSTFDDRLKFTLMAHICTQVICPIMNGKLKYDDPCVYDLLKDSLTIMSLKEMKLNMEVGRGPDEEDEPPAAVVAAAKEMITQIFRKAMIEYVMPALLDLRVYLAEKRSRLRSELYTVFRAICRENKDMIDEFLDGDQQLRAEVEYDIRRYELRLKAKWADAKRRAEQSAVKRRLSRRSLAVVIETEEGNKTLGGSSKNGTTHVEPNGETDKSAPSVDPISRSGFQKQDISISWKSTNDPEISNNPNVEIGSADKEDSRIDVNVLPITKPLSSLLRPAQETTSKTVFCDVEANIDPTGHIHSPTRISKDVNADMIPNVEHLVEKENFHEACAVRGSACCSLVSPARNVGSIRMLTNPNETSVSSRAVSTPNKIISNLTFADLNLSAIHGGGRITSHKRTD